MPIVGKFALLIWFLIIGVLIAQFISIDIAIARDITGWLGRAGAATTAEGMAEYLTNALNGLDKWGMYSGSWAWLYVHPNTRMDIARELLVDLRDRAIEIERTETRGSMGYAESLEEIKRTFAAIELKPTTWYLRHYMPHLFFWWAWLIPLTLIIISIIFLDLDVDFRCRCGFHKWEVKSETTQRCVRCFKEKVKGGK